MNGIEEQIAQFIGKYTPEMQRVAKAARRKMRALFPRAIEFVYDNYNALVFGYGPTQRVSDAICSIAVYPRYVTLFFLRGKKLRDPYKLLGGSGKIVRQIRLDGADDLDMPAIRALVEQASSLAGERFIKRETIIKSISAKQRPRRPAAE